MSYLKTVTIFMLFLIVSLPFCYGQICPVSLEDESIDATVQHAKEGLPQGLSEEQVNEFVRRAYEEAFLGKAEKLGVKAEAEAYLASIKDNSLTDLAKAYYALGTIKAKYDLTDVQVADAIRNQNLIEVVDGKVKPAEEAELSDAVVMEGYETVFTSRARALGVNEDSIKSFIADASDEELTRTVDAMDRAMKAKYGLTDQDIVNGIINGNLARIVEAREAEPEAVRQERLERNEEIERTIDDLLYSRADFLKGREAERKLLSIGAPALIPIAHRIEKKRPGGGGYLEIEIIVKAQVNYGKLSQEEIRSFLIHLSAVLRNKNFGKADYRQGLVCSIINILAPAANPEDLKLVIPALAQIRGGITGPTLRALIQIPGVAGENEARLAVPAALSETKKGFASLALTNVGEPAIPALIEIMNDPARKDFHGSAASTIAEIAKKASADLEKSIAEDAEKIRLEAESKGRRISTEDSIKQARALAENKKKASAEKFEPAILALTGVLSRPDIESSHMRTAEALREIAKEVSAEKIEPAIPYLISILGGKGLITTFALEALVEISKKSSPEKFNGAIQPLMDLISSPGTDIAHSLELLKFIGEPAVQTLIEGLKIPYSRTRDEFIRNACFALKGLAGKVSPEKMEPVIPLLINLLGSPLSTLAIDVLGEIAKKASAEKIEPAVQPLLDIIKNERKDDVLIKSAAEALGEMRVAVNPLIAALTNEEFAFNKGYISYALGRLASKLSAEEIEPAIPALMEDLKMDSRAFPFGKAAEAIGEISKVVDADKVEPAVQILIDSLKEPLPQTRYEEISRGLKALGEKVGYERMSPAIQSLISILKTQVKEAEAEDEARGFWIDPRISEYGDIVSLVSALSEMVNEPDLKVGSELIDGLVNVFQNIEFNEASNKLLFEFIAAAKKNINRFYLYLRRLNDNSERLAGITDAKERQSEINRVIKQTDQEYSKFYGTVVRNRPVSNYAPYVSLLSKLSEDDLRVDLIRIADHLKVPTEGRSLEEIAEDADSKIPNPKIRGSTKKFDFITRETSLVLGAEYEASLKDTLRAMLEPAEVNVNDVKAKIDDIDAKVEALDAEFLTEQGVPKVLIDRGNKKNIRGFLYKKIKLSPEEIKALAARAFDRMNNDLIRKFIEGTISPEEKNEFLTALKEADIHLQDELQTLGLDALVGNVKGSQQWKVITQLKEKISDQVDQTKKATKEIEVVFAKKNLLDLYQGLFSGTCFGDYPYDMAREDVLVAKILNDGELAGSVLFQLQGNKLVMIGFDPSLSLIGSLDTAKEHELIDNIMRQVYDFANENGFQLSITPKAGGLSNRDGFQAYILGKFATTQEVKLEPRTYQPEYQYVVSSARLAKGVSVTAEGEVVERRKGIVEIVRDIARGEGTATTREVRWRRDSGKIIEIEESAFVEELQQDSDELEESFTLPDHIGFIAESNRQPAGYILGSPMESHGEMDDIAKDQDFGERNSVYLESIGVKPEFQRRGIGRQLMKDFLLKAKERGFTKVKAHTNVPTGMRDFMRSLGGERLSVDEDYGGTGIAHEYMEADIDGALEVLEAEAAAERERATAERAQRAREEVARRAERVTPAAAEGQTWFERFSVVAAAVMLIVGGTWFIGSTVNGLLSMGTRARADSKIEKEVTTQEDGTVHVSNEIIEQIQQVRDISEEELADTIEESVPEEEASCPVGGSIGCAGTIEASVEQALKDEADAARVEATREVAQVARTLIDIAKAAEAPVEAAAEEFTSFPINTDGQSTETAYDTIGTARQHTPQRPSNVPEHYVPIYRAVSQEELDHFLATGNLRRLRSHFDELVDEEGEGRSRRKSLLAFPSNSNIKENMIPQSVFENPQIIELWVDSSKVSVYDEEYYAYVPGAESESEQRRHAQNYWGNSITLDNFLSDDPSLSIDTAEVLIPQGTELFVGKIIRADERRTEEARLAEELRKAEAERQAAELERLEQERAAAEEARMAAEEEKKAREAALVVEEIVNDDGTIDYIVEGWIYEDIAFRDDIPKEERRRRVIQYREEWKETGEGRLYVEPTGLAELVEDDFNNLENLIGNPQAKNDLEAALGNPAIVQEGFNPQTQVPVTSFLYDGRTYTLESMIGEGGMAGIYQAKVTDQDGTDLGKVAVKLASSPSRQDHLAIDVLTVAREGGILEKVNQKPSGVRRNTGKLTDEGTDYYFTIMDLKEGENLLALTQRTGLSDVQRINLAIMVLQEVKKLHDNGFLHNDIKLSNLMVKALELLDDVDSGAISLIDLGTALSRDHEGKRQHLMFDSPGYMSPNVEREGYSVNSDLYSVGATLYGVLTGRSVIKDSGEFRTEDDRWENKIVPDEIKKIIDDLLAHRAESVEKAIDDLRQTKAKLGLLSKEEALKKYGVAPKPGSTAARIAYLVNEVGREGLRQAAGAHQADVKPTSWIRRVIRRIRGDIHPVISGSEQERREQLRRFVLEDSARLRDKFGFSYQMTENDFTFDLSMEEVKLYNFINAPQFRDLLSEGRAKDTKGTFSPRIREATGILEAKDMDKVGIVADLLDKSEAEIKQAYADYQGENTGAFTSEPDLIRFINFFNSPENADLKASLKNTAQRFRDEKASLQGRLPIFTFRGGLIARDRLAREDFVHEMTHFYLKKDGIGPYIDGYAGDQPQEEGLVEYMTQEFYDGTVRPMPADVQYYNTGADFFRKVFNGEIDVEEAVKEAAETEEVTQDDGSFRYVVAGRELPYNIRFTDTTLNREQRIEKAMAAYDLGMKEIGPDKTPRELFQEMEQQFGVIVEREMTSLDDLVAQDTTSLLSPQLADDLETVVFGSTDIMQGMQIAGLTQTDVEPPTGGMQVTYVGNVWQDANGNKWLLRESTSTVARNQELSYLIDRDLGVPSAETKALSVAGKDYVLYRYIENAVNLEGFAMDDSAQADVARRIVSDYLLGDMDRHGGNFLVVKDTNNKPVIVSVDHSSSRFDEEGNYFHYSRPRVLLREEMKPEHMIDTVAKAKALKGKLKELASKTGQPDSVVSVLEYRIDNLENELSTYLETGKEIVEEAPSPEPELDQEGQQLNQQTITESTGKLVEQGFEPERAARICQDTPCSDCAWWDEHVFRIEIEYKLTPEQVMQVEDVHWARAALEYVANNDFPKAQDVLAKAEAEGWKDTDLEHKIAEYVRKKIVEAETKPSQTGEITQQQRDAVESQREFLTLLSRYESPLEGTEEEFVYHETFSNKLETIHSSGGLKLVERETLPEIDKYIDSAIESERPDLAERGFSRATVLYAQVDQNLHAVTTADGKEGPDLVLKVRSTGLDAIVVSNEAVGTANSERRELLDKGVSESDIAESLEIWGAKYWSEAVNLDEFKRNYAPESEYEGDSMYEDQREGEYGSVSMPEVLINGEVPNNAIQIHKYPAKVQALLDELGVKTAGEALDLVKEATVVEVEPVAEEVESIRGGLTQEEIELATEGLTPEEIESAIRAAVEGFKNPPEGVHERDFARALAMMGESAIPAMIELVEWAITDGYDVGDLYTLIDYGLYNFGEPIIAPLRELAERTSDENVRRDVLQTIDSLRRMWKADSRRGEPEEARPFPYDAYEPDQAVGAAEFGFEANNLYYQAKALVEAGRHRQALPLLQEARKMYQGDPEQGIPSLIQEAEGISREKVTEMHKALRATQERIREAEIAVEEAKPIVDDLLAKEELSLEDLKRIQGLDLSQVSASDRGALIQKVIQSFEREPAESVRTLLNIEPSATSTSFLQNLFKRRTWLGRLFLRQRARNEELLNSVLNSLEIDGTREEYMRLAAVVPLKSLGLPLFMRFATGKLYSNAVQASLSGNLDDQQVTSRLEGLSAAYTAEGKEDSAGAIQGMIMSSVLKGDNRRVLLERFRRNLAANGLSEDTAEQYLDDVIAGQKFTDHSEQGLRKTNAFIDALFNAKIWPYGTEQYAFFEFANLFESSQMHYMGRAKFKNVDLWATIDSEMDSGAYEPALELGETPSITLNLNHIETIGQMLRVFFHEVAHHVNAVEGRFRSPEYTEGFAEDFEHAMSTYLASQFTESGERTDSGLDILTERLTSNRAKERGPYTYGRALFKAIRENLPTDVYRESVLPRLLDSELDLADALQMASEHTEREVEPAPEPEPVAEEARPFPYDAYEPDQAVGAAEFGYEAHNIYRQAKALIEAGRYQEALPLLRRARILYETGYPDRGIDPLVEQAKGISEEKVTEMQNALRATQQRIKEAEKRTPEFARKYVEETLGQKVKNAESIYDANNYIAVVELENGEKVIYKAFGGRDSWYDSILSYGGQVAQRFDGAEDRFNRDVKTAEHPMFNDVTNVDRDNRIVIAPFIEGRTFDPNTYGYNSQEFRALVEHIHKLHSDNTIVRDPAVNARMNQRLEALFDDPSKVGEFDNTYLELNEELFGERGILHPSSPYAEWFRMLSFAETVEGDSDAIAYLRSYIDMVRPAVRYTDSKFTWAHGDAKGTNYIRRPDGSIMVIDGERGRFADQAMDLGELLEAMIRGTDYSKFGATPSQQADYIKDAINIVKDVYKDDPAALQRAFLWTMTRMFALNMKAIRENDAAAIAKSQGFIKMIYDQAKDVFEAASPEALIGQSATKSEENPWTLGFTNRDVTYTVTGYSAEYGVYGIEGKVGDSVVERTTIPEQKARELINPQENEFVGRTIPVTDRKWWRAWRARDLTYNVKDYHPIDDYYDVERTINGKTKTVSMSELEIKALSDPLAKEQLRKQTKTRNSWFGVVGGAIGTAAMFSLMGGLAIAPLGWIPLAMGAANFLRVQLSNLASYKGKWTHRLMASGISAGIGTQEIGALTFAAIFGVHMAGKLPPLHEEYMQEIRDEGIAEIDDNFEATTTDGVTVRGDYVRNPNTDAAVIWCTGINARPERTARPLAAEMSTTHSMSMVATRGMGRSDWGISTAGGPNEVKDHLAVMKKLYEEEGVRDFALVGYSGGTAAAARIALMFTTGEIYEAVGPDARLVGTVLDSAYTRIGMLPATFFVPPTVQDAMLIMRNVFNMPSDQDPIEWIGKIKGPVLLVGFTGDKRIPIAHSKAILAQALLEGKRDIKFEEISVGKTSDDDPNLVGHSHHVNVRHQQPGIDLTAETIRNEFNEVNTPEEEVAQKIEEGNLEDFGKVVLNPYQVHINEILLYMSLGFTMVAAIHKAVTRVQDLKSKYYASEMARVLAEDRVRDSERALLEETGDKQSCSNCGRLIDDLQNLVEAGKIQDALKLVQAHRDGNPVIINTEEGMAYAEGDFCGNAIKSLRTALDHINEKYSGKENADSLYENIEELIRELEKTIKDGRAEIILKPRTIEEVGVSELREEVKGHKETRKAYEKAQAQQQAVLKRGRIRKGLNLATVYVKGVLEKRRETPAMTKTRTDYENSLKKRLNDLESKSWVWGNRFTDNDARIAQIQEEIDEAENKLKEGEELTQEELAKLREDYARIVGVYEVNNAIIGIINKLKADQKTAVLDYKNQLGFAELNAQYAKAEGILKPLDIPAVEKSIASTTRKLGIAEVKLASMRGGRWQRALATIRKPANYDKVQEQQKKVDGLEADLKAAEADLKTKLETTTNTREQMAEIERRITEINRRTQIALGISDELYQARVVDVVGTITEADVEAAKLDLEITVPIWIKPLVFGKKWGIILGAQLVNRVIPSKVDESNAPVVDKDAKGMEKYKQMARVLMWRGKLKAAELVGKLEAKAAELRPAKKPSVEIPAAKPAEAAEPEVVELQPAVEEEPEAVEEAQRAAAQQQWAAMATLSKRLSDGEGYVNNDLRSAIGVAEEVERKLTAMPDQTIVIAVRTRLEELKDAIAKVQAAEEEVVELEPAEDIPKLEPVDEVAEPELTPEPEAISPDISVPATTAESVFNSLLKGEKVTLHRKLKDSENLDNIQEKGFVDQAEQMSHEGRTFDLVYFNPTAPSEVEANDLYVEVEGLKIGDARPGSPQRTALEAKIGTGNGAFAKAWLEEGYDGIIEADNQVLIFDGAQFEGVVNQLEDAPIELTDDMVLPEEDSIEELADEDILPEELRDEDILPPADETPEAIKTRILSLPAPEPLLAVPDRYLEGALGSQIDSSEYRTAETIRNEFNEVNTPEEE
ncbi:GNAT family N-acetyltransferase, partial [Nanoarchaeota archaeon]